MYQQIKIDKEKVKRICPNCGDKTLEWTGGKVDNSQQEYNCLPCRIAVVLDGFTKEDQETIAEEAFM